MSTTTPPAPKAADLVHLIICLALFRNLRDPLLNIVATYLHTITEKTGKPLAQVMFDEQDTVLGPALQLLSETLMPTMFKARSDVEAEAAIIGPFFEHLATLAGDLPKDA